MNLTVKLAVVVLASVLATALGGCASSNPQGSARALVGFGVEVGGVKEHATPRLARVEPPPFKPINAHR